MAVSPTWLSRAAATALVLGFAAAAAVLLWSDRAPALFVRVVDVFGETGQWIEQQYGVDVADRSDVPATPYQIGHAVLWGTGMTLLGWVARRRIPIALTAIFVSAISLLFEAAQPLLSSSRGFEPADVVANVVGIATAAVVLSVAFRVIRLTGHTDPRHTEPSRDDNAHYAE